MYALKMREEYETCHRLAQSINLNFCGIVHSVSGLVCLECFSSIKSLAIKYQVVFFPKLSLDKDANRTQTGSDVTQFVQMKAAEK